MNRTAAWKRLEALEAQARVTKFDHVVLDPALREVAERYAREADVTVEVLLDECAAIARRIDVIGEAAWEREIADQGGITVEEFRQNCRPEDPAEYAQWLADGSPSLWSWRPRPGTRIP